MWEKNVGKFDGMKGQEGIWLKVKMKIIVKIFKWKLGIGGLCF